MRRLFEYFCLLLSAVFFYAAEAAALSLAQETPAVTVRLQTNTDRINAGQDILVLAEFDIDRGWHILSPAGGDIGLPTNIDWMLPTGYKLAEVRWSQAREFNNDGLVQYVYEGKAYYLARITPPENAAGKAAFSVQVSWQACAEECRPESRRFNFTLPVTEKHLLPAKAWYDSLRAAEKTFLLTEDKIPELADEPVFLFVLLLAFAGGIILNLMPCIFPVLSLKAIALVKGAKRSHKARADALLYTAGVLLSFLLTAFVLAWLRQSGEKAGWGFQLQSPLFVAVLLGIFVVILFMFLDLIKVNNPFTDPMVRLSVKARRFSSFLTGVFSVVIATPCTAPFMGIAIGYALTRPVYYYYPIFLTLGLGYAFPFLILGFFPKLLAGILPKPGKWMVTLKRIFVIPVFLTCVWLGWVLYSQLAARPAVNEHAAVWHAYDAGKVSEAVNNGQKVFIDFTAKWCLICLANEKAALDTAEFAEIVREKNILLFKADWTNRNAEITQALEYYGRSSIPLYVYYDGEKMQVLPQLLTPGVIKDKLR